MEKKQMLEDDTSLPDPLNIFAKRIGKRIHDEGAKSKETIKELLSTTLMPDHHQLICTPYTTKTEICEDIISKDEKDSEKGSETDKDKQAKETLKTEPDASKEEIKEQDSIICSCSDAEEVELSCDGKWLKEHFQIPLKMAIREIVSKKPYDPVNYLGFWLLHYKRCQERNQWELEKENELNYLRSMIREPTVEVEEVPLDSGEEEEEMRDWNYEHYEANETQNLV